MIKSFLILFMAILSIKSHQPKSYLLIAKPDQIVGCGGILFAGQFLFVEEKNSTDIIGIIECLDFYGDKFFKNGTSYNIEFSKDSVLKENFALMNEFIIPPDKRIRKRVITKITPTKPN